MEELYVFGFLVGGERSSCSSSRWDSSVSFSLWAFLFPEVDALDALEMEVEVSSVKARWDLLSLPIVVV